MLDLLLLFILFSGLLVGIKRGFILQTIHLTGFIVAYIVAVFYYDDLAPHLNLWIPYPSFSSTAPVFALLEGDNLEQAYYLAIAFVILFIGSKFLLQIIGSMLDFVAMLPILKQLNRYAGALLGFLEVYLILFILLFIAALLPIEQLQTAMDGSVIAKMMVNHTPYFSSKIQALWIDYVSI
ncbi:CvpA family protein [Bacillus carboniphilus]|uniref:CvpA family protein n=1 Tax=Bacillus carboniphilus TaxID=86663 RepID=A0ABY9JZT9_9BACI|nr:CvpA family protein [Bacillus carboniphilus]WLR44294.1 CvpA family protein [Bacillus carboniphilus]